MSTTYHYFSGTTKWAKVRKPDDKYGNFQVPLYMDEANLKKFRELGLALSVKEDEDGSFVTFKRPKEKLIKGEIVNFGPPKVYNADNTEMTEGLIGNGSKITLKISMYDTVKGPGHRLESLRVDDLVKYESRDSFDPPPPETSNASPKLPF